MQINANILENALVGENWEMFFALANNFYNTNHSLGIPLSFRTIDGVNYDKTGYPLGKWLNLNVKNYANLTKEQKERLHNIGFVSGAIESKWLFSFQLAKKYYEHYGHLKFKKDFRTRNGIDYDIDGFPLASWVNAQKTKHNKLENENRDFLDIEHDALLESIGIVWNVEQNISMIKELCKCFKISFEKNYEKVSNMQYQEFMVKIKFFITNNINFVTKTGILFPPMFYKNNEFLASYGVSIESLIRKEFFNQFEKETIITKN